MTKFVSHFGAENDENVSDEIFMMRLRHYRDIQLKNSDWTQLVDAPVDQSAWATYRQALRDLPASNANPREIDLPVAP
jgi:hypothetical protein